MIFTLNEIVSIFIFTYICSAIFVGITWTAKCNELTKYIAFRTKSTKIKSDIIFVIYTLIVSLVPILNFIVAAKLLDGIKFKK